MSLDDIVEVGEDGLVEWGKKLKNDKIKANCIRDSINSSLQQSYADTGSSARCPTSRRPKVAATEFLRAFARVLFRPRKGKCGEIAGKRYCIDHLIILL
jgi:hypothetical protein